jgi:hypothetical protein
MRPCGVVVMVIAVKTKTGLNAGGVKLINALYKRGDLG